MATYTASNGVKISPRGGNLDLTGEPISDLVRKFRGVDDGPYFETVQPTEVEALREYFQAERDEELNRWRWSENPDYVVYPLGCGVKILREKDASKFFWTRSDAVHFVAVADETGDAVRAAVAYFEAHPEPKPWHDAKPGEVWEILLRGQFLPPEAYAIVDGKFRPVTLRQFWLDPADNKIETARRVYPREGEK